MTGGWPKENDISMYSEKFILFLNKNDISSDLK